MSVMQHHFEIEENPKVRFFFTLGTCRDVKIPGLFTHEILYTYKRDMGPSINDVASLEGGGGGKLTIWGDMRGVDNNFF